MLNCAICDNDKTVINMVKTYNDSCYMCTSCINPSKKKISILVIRWYRYFLFAYTKYLLSQFAIKK